MVSYATRPPLWLLPNVLSLDAPIVAVVWQEFLGQCFETPLRPAGRAALFLTVWAIYLADRLLDVRTPCEHAESAPHRFCRTHRFAASLLLAIALASDAVVIVLWLRPAVLHNGLVVLAAVLAYFAAVHFTGLRPRMPKLAATALLFAVGTFLTAWTFSAGPRVTLLAPGAAYFLLCLANLLAISSGNGSRYPVFVGALALACFAVGGSAWYLAVATSAAAMLALVVLGRRLPLDMRRVLADGVLLSPLLFVR